MEDFGKRLKEERERLGFTQGKFAELCGVGRTAQFNYERGERHPGSLYLDAAEKLGVDTHYVFTATRTGKDWGYARAHSRMLYTFEMLLGLEEKKLEALTKNLVEINAQQGIYEGDQKSPTGIVNWGPWTDDFMAWLKTATKIERCVDVDLLAQLEDALIQAAEQQQVKLPTAKRLRAAIMLYQEAKENEGRIDPSKVENAVKLAA
jgi:transcriptional regulator with XRE-family HTH domain